MTLKLLRYFLVVTAYVLPVTPLFLEERRLLHGHTVHNLVLWQQELNAAELPHPPDSQHWRHFLEVQTSWRGCAGAWVVCMMGLRYSAIAPRAPGLSHRDVWQHPDLLPPSLARCSHQALPWNCLRSTIAGHTQCFPTQCNWIGQVSVHPLC